MPSLIRHGWNPSEVQNLRIETFLNVPRVFTQRGVKLLFLFMCRAHRTSCKTPSAFRCKPFHKPLWVSYSLPWRQRVAFIFYFFLRNLEVEEICSGDAFFSFVLFLLGEATATNTNSDVVLRKSGRDFTGIFSAK